MSSYLGYLTTRNLKSSPKEVQYYKDVNRSLELDLKCEHDEKVELVKIKVNLENQVVNLNDKIRSLENQITVLKSQIGVPEYEYGEVNKEELENMQRKIIAKIERELDECSNKHIIGVLKIEVNNKIQHIIQNILRSTTK